MKSNLLYLEYMDLNDNSIQKNKPSTETSMKSDQYMDVMA